MLLQSSLKAPPRVDTDLVELQRSVDGVRLYTGVAVNDSLPQG